MHALAKTIGSFETESEQKLPDDLRSWFPAHEVLALATEAAELVTQDPAFRKGGFEQFHVSMMLALLGYCYATNRFDSADVESAAVSEEVLLDFVNLPDAPAVRRFRRAYRPWILQCLIYILTQATAESSEMNLEIDCPGIRMEIAEWASRKIELAILMDAAAAD